LDLPDLSVIIPTYNNQSYLKTTVDSLLFSTNLKLEIIIVDDCSEQKELAEYLQNDRVFRFLKIFNIIHNPVNLGYIKSVNRAFAETTAPFILLLNNDVFVPPRMVDKMLEALKNNDGTGAVGPYSNYVMDEQRLEIDYKDPIIDPLPLIKKISELNKPGPELKDSVYLSGFCLLLKRKAIEKVMVNDMLFDEIYGFGYLEDCDLSVRIKRAGYRLGVVRGAFVHHYGSRTFAEKKQQELLARNTDIFMKKWF
jgi:GT2 family glycosyltransferase